MCLKKWPVSVCFQSMFINLEEWAWRSNVTYYSSLGSTWSWSSFQTWRSLQWSHVIYLFKSCIRLRKCNECVECESECACYHDSRGSSTPPEPFQTRRTILPRCPSWTWISLRRKVTCGEKRLFKLSTNDDSIVMIICVYVPLTLPTFPPSFPAVPGKPCSPGTPGAPGWPRSPVGPGSPDLP